MIKTLVAGVSVLAIGAAAAIQTGPPATSPVPRTPLQNVVNADDYPAGLPRAAARAVQVSLTISPDGRVTGCVISSSSGSSQLDQATCRLLRSRARFTPAQDGSGNAVSGDVQANINWAALPATARPAAVTANRITLAPWESVSRIRAQFGQISSCQWQKGGLAPPPPSSNACENPALGRMGLGMAARNGLNMNTAEVIVTLRMNGPGIDPAPEKPSALVDLAAELEIAADGRLTGCRFVRERVRVPAPDRPDCLVIFNGPYIPATDRNGRPIATRQRAELRVEAR